MQLKIACWYLIACLLTLTSTVAAQELMADLTPVVVNAERGYIEVRNVGNAVAGPSQVFVVCSTVRSGKSAPCVADLHLPGYIEKRNVLSYDIPAIQPGSKYTLRLFGPGAFPSGLSDYHMQIISDGRKHIVESDESNNHSSLDGGSKKAEVEENASGLLQVSSETTASQSNDDPNNATITLVVRLHGKPVNFNYGLIFKEKPPARQGRYLRTSDWSRAPVTNGQATIAMYPGKYELTIRQQKEDSRGLIKRVELTTNQNKIVKINLEPLGQLTLEAEINGKASPISAIISSPTGKIDKQQVAQTLTFNLTAGTYAATVEDRTNPEALGYHDKGYTNNIQIAAGQEVLQQVKFHASPAAKLKIEAYLDGKPVKPVISRFYGTSPPYPKVWASFEPVQRDFSVNLGAGAYEITVLLPPITNDKTVFPEATNLSQNRNLKFRPDEDRIEKFEFFTPGIGNLQVAAQVDGDSVRAEIKVRPSDAAGNYFSATPATHDPLTGKANLKLRAGRYVIEVRPAKIGLNLGIDTFQGRSGPLLNIDYIAGIEPMIFKDVVIEPDKTIKLNAEFHQAK